MRVLDTALGWLDRLLQVLIVVCLATVLASVSWQVITRYVTKASSSWTVDLSALAFVWLAMFAIAVGVRQGRHLVFDVWEFLPSKRWLTLTVTSVASLLVVLTTIALTWYGAEGLPSAMRREMPGLGIPFGFVALAVPVGCGLSAVFAVEAWARLVMNRVPERDPLPSRVICEDEHDMTIKGEI